jgi:hypothetical protein
MLDFGVNVLDEIDHRFSRRGVFSDAEVCFLSDTRSGVIGSDTHRTHYA